MRGARTLVIAVAALALGAAAPAATGPPSPAISGVDLFTGKRVSLADFAGRAVVVNFWASWCEGCMQEAHDLSAFARAHPKVVLLGVDTEDARPAGRAFYRRYGFSNPSILDPSGAIGKRLGLAGLPTTVFLDSRHRIVVSVVGAGTRARFEAALRLALAR